MTAVLDTASGSTAPGVRRGPLAVLLASAFVNMLGSSLTMVALPLITLSLGGNATSLGLVGGAETAAAAVGVALCGPLVDRVGPRRLAAASSLLAAVLLTAIPLAAAAHRLGIASLTTAGAAAAFTAAPGMACRQRLVGEAARAAAMPQDRAGALYWVFPRSGIAVGALLSAVLLSRLGISSLIWCDSASFVLSAVLLPGVRTRDGSAADTSAGTGYIRGLVAGSRALTGSPVLRTVSWIAFVLSAADGPRTAVVAPLYLRECHSPPSALAWLIGAYTAGSLAGLGGYTALVGPRLRQGRVVVGCLLATAAAYLAMAAAPGLIGGSGAAILGAAAMTAMGAAQGPFLPILASTVYEHCSVEAGSAALSTLLGITSIAVPIGILGYGAALATVPLWSVLALSAALFTVACGPIRGILPHVPGAA